MTGTQTDQIELGPLGKAWHLNGHANLGMHVAVLGRLMDRCVARRLSEYDLNLAQWRSVALLHALGPSTFMQMAHMSWMDRGDLSRALVKMQEKGFVSKHANPDDGRSQIFTLTNAGQAMYQRFAAEWRIAEAQFATIFTSDELSEFNEQLERMAQKCLQLLDDATP